MNNETVTISREEYESLKKANEELSKQVQYLMEQIALARSQRFGSSSERSKFDDGSEQLSFLFNEAEVYTDSSSVPNEPDLTTVKEHKRNRKHLTRETDLPEDIETEIVIRDVPESERICDICGEQLERIGEDVIRRLKIVPAKYVVVETHILDFNSSIYGETAMIRFYSYVRPEQKFENLDALKKQIESDKKKAFEFFKEQ